MTNTPSWQERNGAQLSAAILEMRQRLEDYVERQPSGRPAPPAASGPSRSFFQRLIGASSAPASADADDGSAGSATADPKSSVSAEPPPALEVLCKQLGLSPFERQVLVLCTAVELDTRFAALCARAHDDPQKPYPTFALALSLFGDASWDVLSPDRPLRYWRLLEIRQSGIQPLTTSPLRADERIVNYLKGLGYLDERISGFMSPFDVEVAAALAPSQTERVEHALRQLQHSAGMGRIPVVQLLGADGVSKQLVADHCADALRLRLCRLPAEMLPAAPPDADALARLWQRESRLLPLALYVDGDDLDSAGDRAGLLARFLSRIDGVTFLAVRDGLSRVTRPMLSMDVARPTVAEQVIAWTEALGPSAPDAPAALASQFGLNIPAIQHLARLAAAESAEDAATLGRKAWEVCCAAERPRLDTLAQRLTPKAGWADLVLPPVETALLRQIAAQVGQRDRVYREWGFEQRMNRGFGITALFAGDSGTGKTMAAEVIAAGLHLELYRIDLSAVVNKYIGETEKNLRRLFDSAEGAGAILFFDEADALFGKRSEVKDSHDRYANIEVNYLLQRIESYAGLAILATNMKAALDPAFLRRLRFVVSFPFPEIADRRRLWERAFLQPAAARGLPAPPLAPLDYNRLARLNLAGGHIHNVALNATFMAAHAGGPVSMALIFEAARAEFLKLERPINEADFRWSDVPASPAKSIREAEPVLT
jgi:hypothetical protein